mmetsp:Transcript_110573/g.202678  ORF Transcript_110573/g.202678 Transcript_110573/m.202678 type:complete len:105 (+) Transcript_110573:199-513(+)
MGCPEVNELDVWCSHFTEGPFGGNKHYILWFQITVNQRDLGQALQGRKQLSRYNRNNAHWKTRMPMALQTLQQVWSQEFERNTDVAVVTEGVQHLHHMWMIDQT